MRALLAVWRVSLHRTLADWPIVTAAWLITFLAATLLAGATIYPSAAAEAGLRRALLDAPAEDLVLNVERYTASGGGDQAEAIVQPALARVMAGLGGSVVRDWRTGATLGLPPIGTSAAGDQAVLGSLDTLSDHATLVAGTWPTARAPGEPSHTIEGVVVDTLARELDLQTGDVVPLVAHAVADSPNVAVRVVGIFSIDLSSDPFWTGDEQLLAGIEESPRYRTFGPFLVAPEDLLASPVGALRQRWRANIRLDGLAVDQAGELRARIAALPAELVAAGGQGFEVRTGLGAILSGVERSLLVSRTGVLLLVAQLLLLAAYAIVLTASLLVDHRRVGTSLLRSRGAGPGEVAALALVEGLVLAVPAVALAPWLAVAALRLLNDAGPLAEVGIAITPVVTNDAYVGAAIAGLGCVALLVLPAFLAARGYAAEQGGLSRQETRTFGQRMGLDLALLAVTGVALWQLRLYGAPLTRTVQGTLGIDPLLVAAPAIGMIAGAVLALRVLPLLAEMVEAAFTRGRDLVLSLGSRQLARRPLRYTRTALLLMLAMSMGVFGLSYAATWSSSQRDQAAYQAGADVRVVPGRGRDALPVAALATSYGALPGVESITPVERLPSRISFASAGSADVLAIDAGAAPGIVLARGDVSTAPLAALLAPLVEGRPDPALPALPAGTTYLLVRPAFDHDAFGRMVVDEETGGHHFEPLEPGEAAEIQFRASAVVRDGHGVLQRFESALVTLEGPDTTILVPVGTPEIALEGPLSIASVGAELWLPPMTGVASGPVGLTALAAGVGPDGPWTDVPLGAAGTWSARMAPGQQALVTVPAGQVSGTTIEASGAGALGGIVAATRGPAAQIAFVPASIAGGATGGGPEVPVLANRAFVEATSSAAGEIVPVRVEGGPARLVIAGVIDTFPTTDPGRPLLLFDEPTLSLLRLQGSGAVRSPDEWWLAARDGTEDAILAALADAPFHSAGVVGALDRARSLSSDPVALGVIGALALGFVVTGLFAVVGLAVSGAVSARQRRTEFALLRALGLSGRQLFGSLWLENGSVVLVSLVAGTGLGLLIGWIALPFITVTQAASAPIPPVQVQVPWGSILGLELVSAVALGIAVIVIGGVLRRLGVGSVLRMGED